MKSLFEVGDINRGRAVSMVWGFPPSMTSCKGAGVMLARGVGLTQAGYSGPLWQGKSPCLRDLKDATFALRCSKRSLRALGIL